jgi:hypothetical protein
MLLEGIYCGYGRGHFSGLYLRAVRAPMGAAWSILSGPRTGTPPAVPAWQETQVHLRTPRPHRAEGLPQVQESVLEHSSSGKARGLKHTLSPSLTDKGASGAIKLLLRSQIFPASRSRPSQLVRAGASWSQLLASPSQLLAAANSWPLTRRPDRGNKRYRVTEYKEGPRFQPEAFPWSLPDPQNECPDRVGQNTNPEHQESFRKIALHSYRPLSDRRSGLSQPGLAGRYSGVPSAARKESKANHTASRPSGQVQNGFMGRGSLLCATGDSKAKP